ncbi:TldD/PmbA family protein [Streptomyces griseiscabiei]|uniref:TldD/PmbA family protein n=1 Tax=Streptomyces griseiscabiei TaxID=2993540 RepID=A0ABU4LE74_9ACTN|nr:TldD/PmbA family protein [Streptomyces griseiscabiei]MBZ3902728.1 TldD/PmbA family protein [Streptomyces griseiscabiei]MDX2914081.1 TldD/PmbA family protein [Streptomyces griseiscabiei]
MGRATTRDSGHKPAHESARAISPQFDHAEQRRVAEAALERARELGVGHAEFRAEHVRDASWRLRDARPAGASDTVSAGFSVRVLHEGARGFAARSAGGADAAVGAVEEAVRAAGDARRLGGRRVDLAPEPVYGERTWISAYETDPFEVSGQERTAVLGEYSARLLAALGVRHADAALQAVRECTFLADTAGNRVLQQRVRVLPEFTAHTVDPAGGRLVSLRSTAPSTGRGWEYLLGTGWDWDGELAALPALLAEKAAAPTVRPGTYDLVIDPTNLWLTLHETVGHATELDRALGHEASFAGTSFASPDAVGTLRYGSPAMNVTADRTAPHGLATIGYDAEAVAAQRWDLVRAGVLSGFQVDRAGAARAGYQRSNGCSFAGAFDREPLQRMPNVSLRPAPDGPDTAELISRVRDGLYVVGDGSWSIDTRRQNFQFTGQRFHRIRAGRLVGQVGDVAYQSTTTDFWRSLEAVGGPQTYLLCGAFHCGKGRPLQAAPAGHGSPAALFRQVNVLNSREEN